MDKWISDRGGGKGVVEGKRDVVGWGGVKGDVVGCARVYSHSLFGRV